MATAAAYLRKPKVRSNRDLSWEVQESQIREIAARHGDNDLVLLADWNRSGRAGKTHLRKNCAQLKRMIEAGEASVLYS